jgi:predicted transcriptional regulator of viral defense system
VNDGKSAGFARVITTAKLEAAGFSDERIRRLVRQGVLLRVGRGVYAPAALVGDMATDPVGENVLRTAGALAVAKPGAVASHHSAATIHGLDLLGRPLLATTLTHRPGAGSGSRRPGVRVHVAALPRGHVTVRSGVRVTSVARTVVDLARISSFRAGVVAADSALRGKQVSKDELRGSSRTVRGGLASVRRAW